MFYNYSVIILSLYIYLYHSQLYLNSASVLFEFDDFVLVVTDRGRKHQYNF